MASPAEIKKPLIFLWFFCVLGWLAVLPYAYQVGIIPESIPISKLALISTLQYGLMYALILYLCYLLIPKTDLSPFRFENPLRRIILPGIVVGVLVGIALYELNKSIFHESVLSQKHSSYWSAILASLYGAINEEVMMRLFLFTLIYFLIGKICKNNRVMFWTTNILVAIAFGVTHLPAALAISSLSSYEISRVLLLNGFVSLVLGWLYVMNGFYAGALAHFIADIFFHAILI